MRLVVAFAWTMLLLLRSAVPAFAVNVPNFPQCAAPQGAIIANYPSGIHGIVGSTDSYSGSDTVYQVSQDQVMQCFCAENGQGIQTNWWKASSLDQEQVSTLVSQGWYYIPNGDLWGLTVDPYLAINSSFSCLPSSSTPSSTTTTTTTSTTSSNTGGEVHGTGTGGAVLGLAATGNTLTLLTVFVFALAFVVAGVMRIVGTRHAKNN